MKSIHDSSDSYLSQIMFIKWFLMHSNVNITLNNDYNIVYNVPKNKQCNRVDYSSSGRFIPMENVFMDMFFHNFSDLKVNDIDIDSHNINITLCFLL